MMGMHVNVANIEATIEHIKDSPHFDMQDYHYCIRAHAADVAGRPRHKVTTPEMGDFLGISEIAADCLFTSALMSKRDAIKALRLLAETGEVLIP
jgi:hypothetical protein